MCILVFPHTFFLSLFFHIIDLGHVLIMYYLFICFILLGTSDPYVKFKISGKQLYKSRTVNRTLEPYWDEFFTIPVEDVFEPLHIRVYDYDFALQDDYMGSAQIDLTHLELNR